ncbi:UDP-N-acetyl-D-mannosamine dehydrogenase [subsurface metagenome]
MKKICVVGLGYIGLPTACYLAKAGCKVIGVDTNEKIIHTLKKGKTSFEEPGLQSLFNGGFKNFEFFLTPKPADVFIISVPTPITKTKKPNLSYIKRASRDIAKVIQHNNLVIIESTITPGCSEKIVLPILKKEHPDYRIFLAHAPERAIPGRTLTEMIENDRVIGGIDKESTELAKNLYSTFIKGKIFLTDTTTAETVKLLENTYRDINIAFANEIAKHCDKIGINVWEAIKIANLHPRVNIHLPGPGVGGHCISVDPWFLMRKDGVGIEMIKLSRMINDSMPNYIIKCVSKMLKDIKNPTITILGAAYKANVDDWRETPALKIIDLAQNNKWNVKVHDPLLKDFPYEIEKDFKKATQDSDCLLILADHSFYQTIKPLEIKNMKNKNIFDSRNSIDEVKWKEADFIIKILGK